MDVEDLSIEQLEQLLIQRKSERDSKIDTDNYFPVIGNFVTDSRGTYIEVFSFIEKREDLSILDHYNLRMRFNTHREFQFFYFKVSKESFNEIQKLVRGNDLEHAKAIHIIKKISGVSYFNPFH